MNNLTSLSPLLSTGLALLIVLIGSAFSLNSLSSDASLEPNLKLIDDDYYSRIGACFPPENMPSYKILSNNIGNKLVNYDIYE